MVFFMEGLCSSDLPFGLPVDCIAIVLSFTSPKDVCRFCLVSSSFRDVAMSDSVWERFLPSDVAAILPDSSDWSQISSKMKLFFRLCVSPVLFDGNRKSLWMDKVTGKKCYMIGARDLDIVWGDTPQYWAWSHCPDSRFGEVAELMAVCWLEMRVKINANVLLSQGTKYSAYFVFKLKEYSSGFTLCPVELSLRAGETVTTRNICLEPRRKSRRVVGLSRMVSWTPLRRRGCEEVEEEEDIHEGPALERREDGWLEVEMGEMDGSGEVEISVVEVNGGHWKSGLLVCGIEIRPKCFL